MSNAELLISAEKVAPNCSFFRRTTSGRERFRFRSLRLMWKQKTHTTDLPVRHV